MLAHGVEFQLRSHLIVLPVEIDGQERAFALDTAAAVSLIDRRAAGAARRERTVDVDPGWHDSATVPASLRVGETRLAGVPLGLVDLHEHPRYHHEGVQGVLGHDVLSRFRILIDYSSRLIALKRRVGL
jgi:hypothetical protein